MTRTAVASDATGMSSGTIAGGVVLAAYGVGVAAALVARRHAWETAARAWLAIAILLGALALEKALRAETLILRRGEDIAIAGGWYAERAGFQLRMIGALAVAGLVGAALIGRSLRRAGAATRAAAISAVLIAAFVLVRTVSFHRIDRLLATGVGPLRVSNVVELAGLGIIVVCAWAVTRADARNGGG